MTTARHSMDSPEWYSPADYVEAARSVMGGIDLDPASHEEANRTVKAARFYTAEEDGLRRDWRGRIYLNPPGGEGLVPAFWRKLMEEHRAGRVIAFVWMGYSVEQLQTLQDDPLPLLDPDPPPSPLDFPICVPRRRIAFVENEAKRIARLARVDEENEARRKEGKPLRDRNESGGSPSHANFLAYGGHDAPRFASVLSRFGRVRL
ncbi:MAG: DNA N-6-adenine-methyltransferase [Pseudomonadota bacterium]